MYINVVSRPSNELKIQEIEDNKTKRLNAALIIIGVIGALATAYGMMSLFTSSHFFPLIFKAMDQKSLIALTTVGGGCVILGVIGVVEAVILKKEIERREIVINYQISSEDFVPDENECNTIDSSSPISKLFRQNCEIKDFSFSKPNTKMFYFGSFSENTYKLTTYSLSENSMVEKCVNQQFEDIGNLEGKISELCKGGYCWDQDSRWLAKLTKDKTYVYNNASKTVYMRLGNSAQIIRGYSGPKDRRAKLFQGYNEIKVEKNTAYLNKYFDSK